MDKFSSIIDDVKKAYPRLDISCEVYSVADPKRAKAALAKDVDVRDIIVDKKIVSVTICFPNKNKVTHIKAFDHEYTCKLNAWEDRLFKECEKLKLKIKDY